MRGKTAVVFLSCFCFLTACGAIVPESGSCTSAGNPADSCDKSPAAPSYRSVSGQFDQGATAKASVGRFSQLSLLETATSFSDVAASSCPAERGSIKVRALASEGDPVDVDVSEDGSFSLSLEEDKIYSLLFFQGETRCGELVYAAFQSDPGEVVVVGKGSEDLELGKMNDLGDGQFYAENDYADHFDSDADSTADYEDRDVDGDGLPDVDCDVDGLPDYLDNEVVCAGLSACDVVEMVPYDGGILFTDFSGVGALDLYLNNSIVAEGINGSAIRVSNLDGDLIVDGFPVAFDPPDAVVTSLTVGMDSGGLFEDYTSYVLTIPAGTFTCTDGSRNERDITAEFFVIQDFYTDFEEADYDFAQVHTGSLETTDFLSETGTYAKELIVASVPEGQVLNLLLESDDFDAYLFVYYVDGDEYIYIGENDDYGLSTDSLLQVTAKEAGDYAIVITSFSEGETGDYTLTVFGED